MVEYHRLSTIGHHSRMWKFGPEGSEGAQKVPNMAENVPKVTYWILIEFGSFD